MGRDAGSDRPQARHDGLEVGFDCALGTDPEFLDLAGFGRGVCRAQESLGRYAADIQTVAAHLGPLNQCNACTEARGAGCGNQARSACADHH